MSAATEKIDDCWNRVGVWGSEEPRCPELERVTHCQNCRVYSDSGRRLLDRAVPDDYVREWTENLARAKDSGHESSESAVVFRLGNEWFALATNVVSEVTEIRPMHSIPHNRNRVLRGLVNIRGELHLCVSLGYLFGLEKGDGPASQGGKVRERIMVIERNGDRYAFPVSEILSISHFHREELNTPPATIANASATYITGVLPVKENHAGCIDEELLFHGLRRNVS